MWRFSSMPYTNFRRGPAPEAEFDSAAIVAVGSNLAGRHGPPTQMVRRALAELSRLSGRRPLHSSLYSSDPVDCPVGAPDFVNAVAALWPAPTMAPEELLRRLLALETELGGRRAGGGNAPRKLDLDLIAWGDRVSRGPELRLPHPRFAGRRFVLAPLAELAPDWIPPGYAQTVRQLLHALPNGPSVAILAT